MNLPVKVSKLFFKAGEVWPSWTSVTTSAYSFTHWITLEAAPGEVPGKRKKAGRAPGVCARVRRGWVGGKTRPVERGSVHKGPWEGRPLDLSHWMACVAERTQKQGRRYTREEAKAQSNCSCKSLRGWEAFWAGQGRHADAVRWALQNISKAKVKIVRITSENGLLLRSHGSSQTEKHHFSSLHFDSSLPFSEDDFKWERTSGRSSLSSGLLSLQT